MPKIEPTFLLSQSIAVFFVMLGAVCVGVACHFKWAELSTLGAGVAGAGLQAFTSQVRQYLHKDDTPAAQ